MANDQNEKLISVSNIQPKFTTSNTFLQLEKEIPQIIQQANQILNVPLEDLDEDNLSELSSKLKDTKRYYKRIVDARNDVNTFMKKQIEANMAVLDKKLQDMGLDQLDTIATKISQIQKDSLNLRKEKRWNEMETIFNQALIKHTDLKTYVPSLVSFNKFRMTNPKLISGAKNKNITSSTKNAITQYIGSLENDVKTILALDSQFQEKLFNEYQISPDLTRIITLNNSLIQQEIDRQKAVQAEIDRKAKIQAEALAQELIKKQQPQIKPENQINIQQSSRKNEDNPFSISVESFIQSKYPNIQSDEQKFDAIFDLINQIGVKHDQNVLSVINSKIKGLDAIKLIILSK